MAGLVDTMTFQIGYEQTEDGWGTLSWSRPVQAWAVQRLQPAGIQWQVFQSQFNRQVLRPCDQTQSSHHDNAHHQYFIIAPLYICQKCPIWFADVDQNDSRQLPDLLVGTDPADSQVFVTFYTSNLVHNLYLILQGLGSAETTSNAAGIDWYLTLKRGFIGHRQKIVLNHRPLCFPMQALGKVMATPSSPHLGASQMPLLKTSAIPKHHQSQRYTPGQLLKTWATKAAPQKTWAPQWEAATRRSPQLPTPPPLPPLGRGKKGSRMMRKKRRMRASLSIQT